MAKKTNENKGDGRVVELKDKNTGFYDPITRFKIVHEQQLPLGDSVGTKTNKAILSGALLVVSGSVAKDKPATDQGDDFDLPADLPGREAFIAEGLTTFESVKELDTEEKLLAVKGIGKGTVKALAEWATANSADDK